LDAPFWTIIVAAGCGQRFGASRPKQYLDLAGSPALVRALRPFLEQGDPERVILVIPPEDGAFIREMLGSRLPDFRPLLVPGGATRQESVRRGLGAIADEEGQVAVHDAARPLFRGERLGEWRALLDEHDGVIPVLAIHDTVLETRQGRVTRVLDRRHLGAVQTPQLFRLSALRTAHREALDRGENDAGDDGGLLLAIGADLRTVPGEPGNFKITRPEDFARAERELGERHD